MKYVSKQENLRKLQEVELEMLKDFDKFCKEHNLTYYLAYGTLLGAVRHKGFIPWDDDIDIHMDGENYLKLIELLKDNKNPKYLFQSIETEKNYYLFWNKIRLRNTMFIEKGWEKVEMDHGISFDIFPLIENPDNKLDDMRIETKYLLTKVLLGCNLAKYKIYQDLGPTGNILLKVFRLIPQSIRNKIIKRNIQKLCRYKSKKSEYFVSPTRYYRKQKKAYFAKTVKLQFEDAKFDCPVGYDEYLKIVFGDYMELPKEEDRIGHGETYLCFDTREDE